GWGDGYREAPPLPVCLTISRQAFSHRRHSSAQSFIILSCPSSSQALPQRVQASAHDEQMRSENGPCRATIWAAAEQKLAQSWHVRIVFMCSFWPLAARWAQWTLHASQIRWQSLQLFAHWSKAPPWPSCSAAGACFSCPWAGA